MNCEKYLNYDSNCVVDKNIVYKEGVLDKKDCDDVLCINYRLNAPINKKYINCYEVVLDNSSYTSLLWNQQFKDDFAFNEILDEYGNVWQAEGINPVYILRIYDYDGYINECEIKENHITYMYKNMATIFIYINTLDVFYGGSIKFMKENVCVQPTSGSAVCFVNKDTYFTENKNKMHKVLLHMNVTYKLVECKNIPLYRDIYDLAECVNNISESSRILSIVKNRLVDLKNKMYDANNTITYEDEPS